MHLDEGSISKSEHEQRERALRPIAICGKKFGGEILLTAATVHYTSEAWPLAEPLADRDWSNRLTEPEIFAWASRRHA